MHISQAMKAVYTYFLPEVRAVIADTNAAIPPESFLVRNQRAEVRRVLREMTGCQIVPPATVEGAADLDAIHDPLLARLLSHYEEHARGVSAFTHRYPSSGSSEGLFHVLAFEHAKGAEKLYVLDGEYEGAPIQAQNLGISVVVVDPAVTDISKLEPGLWYLSNPSARDGNIINNSFVTSLCEAGNRLLLDLAYVGATRKYCFDLTHPNIAHVVLSLSKPYGLFRYRIGATLSRCEIPSLYGNRWFKDITRLAQGVAVVEKLGIGYAWRRYQETQRAIVEQLRSNGLSNLRTSDVFLLANIGEGEREGVDAVTRHHIQPFKRGSGYRFCLTPFFEMLEQRPLNMEIVSNEGNGRAVC